VAEIKLPFANLKVEYSRSHPLTKVVVIAVIVLSMAALITLGVSRAQKLREIENMRQEAAQLESENEDLRDKLGQLDSVEGVEQIAQEELDMVDPDTIVIEVNP